VFKIQEIKIFRSLYDQMMRWSMHRHAAYYLAGVSFVESSFFPIPPDVMLIPMVLNRPMKAWEYAFVTTLFSILGGLFGYMIGYFAFEWLAEPFIQLMGYGSAYDTVVRWFNDYGIWIIILAGFTPIPYKIFTIAAGMTHMLLWPFIIGSCIGRAMRFFLVAALVSRFGKRVESIALKYIEWIGWFVLLAVIAGVCWYRCVRS
jgi:membrane protein YqaA with SNARE-associated domain